MEKEQKTEAERLCVSVFKSDGGGVTKELYTEKWLEVIRALERRS